MCQQPRHIEFDLPAWVDAYIADIERISGLQQRMSFVVEAARRNVEQQTGGPFAAAIFERDSGRLIALGVNRVTPGGLSILHAEMVAFAVAQRKLGNYDLGAESMPAHELVTSAEPCAMCFGALIWSGVRRLVTGAREQDVRAIGFDEGPRVQDWRGQLASRGIESFRDVGREQAVRVLGDYLVTGGVLYNSRAG